MCIHEICIHACKRILDCRLWEMSGISWSNFAEICISAAIIHPYACKTSCLYTRTHTHIQTLTNTYYAYARRDSIHNQSHLPTYSIHVIELGEARLREMQKQLTDLEQGLKKRLEYESQVAVCGRAWLAQTSCTWMCPMHAQYSWKGNVDADCIRVIWSMVCEICEQNDWHLAWDWS